MANKKISDLTAGSALTGAELIEIEQSSSSAKAALNGLLKTYFDTLYVPTTIAASYYKSSTSSDAIINFNTLIYDTHSAVTTGASWKFTAPRTGNYEISGFLNGAVNTYVTLYKNNALYHGLLGYMNVDGVTALSLALPLTAGDYIDVRASSASIVGAALTGGASHISIKSL